MWCIYHELKKDCKAANRMQKGFFLVLLMHALLESSLDQRCLEQRTPRPRIGSRHQTVKESLDHDRSRARLRSLQRFSDFCSICKAEPITAVKCKNRCRLYCYQSILFPLRNRSFVLNLAKTKNKLFISLSRS